MPLAPLILEAITPTPEPPMSIFLAGVDVVHQVGVQGNGYYVPIGSIAIDEQGPGGISTLNFDLVDPLGVGPVPHDGDEVQHWDNLNSEPRFAGFVSNWTTTVLPSSLGRVTSISCVGFEVILDWALIPFDLVIPAFTKLYTAIQSCAANAEGTGPLRTFANLVGGEGSTQARPVSGFAGAGHFGLGEAAVQYQITIAAGTTLREAIAQCGQASWGGDGTVFNTPVPASALATVDFYRGLRAFADSAAASWRGETALTILDTMAGTFAADTLEHETDATQIVRGVFIKGANAAGTGYASDGSGKPGKRAYINDSTIDTAAKLADAQSAYLNQFVIANRGSFDLVDWTPPAGVGVGSVLTLTDAQANVTGTYRIYQVAKRFLKSGRETWTVTYGGLRPSANRLIRRLTRATRS